MTGIMGLLLLIAPASALSVDTYIDMVGGTVSIKHTVNNNTAELQINGSASFEVHADDSIFDYKINGTDEGMVQTSFKGEEYNIDATVDGRREIHSGTDVFSIVFHFIKEIVLSGWVIF